MHRLDGRAAVVTGAGRGFGLAIAERFRDAGADLALTYRSSAEACERVAAEVRDRGGRAVAVRADLAEPDAGERVAAAARQALGRVDVLVNNAGAMRVERFADSRPEHWRDDVEVNVLGTMRLTHALLGDLLASGDARIVNLSSQVAGPGWEVAPVYAGTKGFVLTWTKSLARELGPRGVTVNAIGPGGILTDMNAEVYPDEEARRRRTEQLPLRRFGSVDDVAACALFLAGDGAGFVTGQMLSPNGGGVM